MKRTRPLVLVLFAVFGGLIGWLLELALVAGGAAIEPPPYTLALVLAIIGILIVAFALPVRRAVREREANRIDPFYATRVVMLAKASSMAGSLLLGAGIGILLFLLTRSVVAGLGSVYETVATLVGSAILLIGGLVAEYMCSIPPDDEEPGEQVPVPGRPHS